MEGGRAKASTRAPAVSWCDFKGESEGEGRAAPREKTGGERGDLTYEGHKGVKGYGGYYGSSGSRE